jgi:hypothetical protein
MYFATTRGLTGSVESGLPLSAATALALLRHATGTSVQIEIRDAKGNIVTVEYLQRQVDLQKSRG